MNIIFTNFFIAFYSLGTIFLPLSDFSLIKDLPAMYNQCKTTEDKDMTVVDFMTDHLINLDCVFDEHTNEDKQKPHKPFNNNKHQTLYKILSENSFFKTGDEGFIKNIKSTKINNFKNNLYFYSLIFSIFHPPIIY